MPSKFASAHTAEIKLNPIDEKKTVVAKLASEAYPIEHIQPPAPMNPISKRTYRNLIRSSQSAGDVCANSSNYDIVVIVCAPLKTCF